ncbi:hypothetical protein TrVE_jg13867 [Triparma verrucosa]|uniref:Fungal lipase-type domain-containing protein n=1 Tax=Triparma verrucosa TaxID=1606542 RepID=A0A9W7EXP3_9STRA|nr:hypothetical protein TrVE_jg13867 [Triparma verrucosa]
MSGRRVSLTSFNADTLAPEQSLTPPHRHPAPTSTNPFDSPIADQSEGDSKSSGSTPLASLDADPPPTRKPALSFSPSPKKPSRRSPLDDTNITSFSSTTNPPEPPHDDAWRRCMGYTDGRTRQSSNPPKAWDYSSQRQVLSDKKEMDFRRRSFLNELQKKISHKPIDLQTDHEYESNPLSPSTKNPFNSRGTKGPFTLQPKPYKSNEQNRRFVIMESLSTFQTFMLFILPYMFLLLSAFLDSNLSMFKETIHSTTTATHTHITPDSMTARFRVHDVPPLSSFLTADAKYANISSSTLKSVRHKEIVYSTMITQGPTNNPTTIYQTKPSPLPLACDLNDFGSYSCESPRLLDVLFSAPGSNVLSGRTADITISYAPAIQNVANRDLLESLAEIFSNASYDIEKETMGYARLQSIIRFLCLSATLAFIYGYVKEVWRGWRDLLGRGGRWGGGAFSIDLAESEWWTTPMTLIPERRFVVLLLACLVLIENPVAVFMQLSDTAAGSPTIRALADMVVGIGIHTFLFSWLLLVDGMRFHTGSAVLTRTKQQKDLRIAREAFEHVKATAGAFESSTQLPSGGLVLKHDPRSAFFSDFMTPKLLLLCLSIISLIAVILSRFPETLGMNPQGPALSTLYLMASLVQLLLLLVWVYLICGAAIRTSKLLKEESFFVTRYAQLAFRILANTLLLAVVVIVVPALWDLRSLAAKWGGSTSNSVHTSSSSSSPSISSSTSTSDTSSFTTLVFGEKHGSVVDRMIRAVTAETSHLPFCATSTSIGPGKLLYVTLCCLVVGLIFFLPRRRDGGSGGDSRFVVNLSRMTHTWRLFPLAISLRSREPATYVPVFCTEIACLLLECSWQSYYNTSEYSTGDFAPGKMNLGSLGVTLYSEIVDELSDTHCYVLLNSRQITDGDDSDIVIVVFRGTVSKENMKTDLDFEQVGLPIEGGGWGRSKRRAFTRAGSGSGYGTIPLHDYGDGGEDGDDEDMGGGFWTLPDFNEALSISEDDDLFPDVNSNVRVHKGFRDSYGAIRNRVLTSVLQCVEGSLIKNPNPPKIYVTGHSLGGALGQLFAFDLACNVEIGVPLSGAEKNTGIVGVNKRAAKRAKRGSREKGRDGFMLSGKGGSVKCQLPVACYTYGQPKVGNAAFSAAFSKRVPHCFRISVEGDLFTGLPRWTCGRGIYKHAGTEVVIDDKGIGTICIAPTPVESTFRFNKSNFSLANHGLGKYRESLEAAFEQEELEKYYNEGGDGVFGGGALVPDWLYRGREGKK